MWHLLIIVPCFAATSLRQTQMLSSGPPDAGCQAQCQCCLPPSGSADSKLPPSQSKLSRAWQNDKSHLVNNVKWLFKKNKFFAVFGTDLEQSWLAQI